jgi:RNA-directed DNA polymerase
VQNKICWNQHSLKNFISAMFKKLKRKNRSLSDKSYWWIFSWSWSVELPKRLDEFIRGCYKFEPMKMIPFKDETITLWSHQDRFFIRTLFYLIKPMFKHIVSKRCLHLQGPSGVSVAIDLIKKALLKGDFYYFARIDVSGFYASIDRKILTQQVQGHFQDPRMLNYLDQVINIPTLQNGAIINPTNGIPRRSSLSNFFSAIYLAELDRAFDKKSGIFYLRYQDDIIALTRTKREFEYVKRRIKKIFSELKLRYARTKTKMGVLNRGFHMLGIEFKLNIEPRSKGVAQSVKTGASQSHSSKNHLQMLLHERCCFRAQEKVSFKEADSESPDKVQRYLLNWSRWWSRVAQPISRTDCLARWIDRVQRLAPNIAWVGRGLLHYVPHPSPAAGRVLLIQA